MALAGMAGSQAGGGFANGHAEWSMGVLFSGMTGFYTYTRHPRHLRILGRTKPWEQNSCLFLPLRVAVLKVGTLSFKCVMHLCL